jgi:hypothetical protein
VQVSEWEAFQQIEREKVKQKVNSELYSTDSARVKIIKQDTGYPLRSSVKYRPKQFYLCLSDI